MAKGKTYVITNHGKERVKTRGGYDRKQEVLALFKNALRNGKSPSEFKPPFSDFLKSKLNRGAQVKVYSNMIFIYKNKTLITCYLVPERYLQQISDEKRRKSIRNSFSGMHNKQLRNEFLRSLEMLCSYCIIGLSIKILEEPDSKRELVELWEKTGFILDELYIRIGGDDEQVSSLVLDDDSLVPIMKESIQGLRDTTQGMLGFGGARASKTSGQHKRDRKNFYAYLLDLKVILEYLNTRNFFLVQNQVIESNENGRLENVKERKWKLW